MTNKVFTRNRLKRITARASATRSGIRTCFTALLLWQGTIGYSQIGTFSQFHLLPYFTNGGSTGAIDISQITMAYRKQSLGAGLTYESSGLSLHKPLYNSRERQLGAAGLAVVHGRAGFNGMFRTTQALVGFTYNLDIAHNQILSLGTQTGYQQSDIDLSSVTTASQYSPQGYDPLLWHGENLGSGKTAAFLVNAGVLWQRLNSTGNPGMFLGFAGSNINRPNFSFTNHDKDPLPIRYVAHGGINACQQNRLVIQPNFRWIGEASTHQLSIGSRFQYILEQTTPDSKGRSVSANIWYNTKRAATMSVDFMHPKFTLGMAYDLPLTSDVQDRQLNNAIEVVFALNLGKPGPKRGKMAKESTATVVLAEEEKPTDTTRHEVKITPTEKQTGADPADRDRPTESSPEKDNLTSSETKLFDHHLLFELNSAEITDDSESFLVAMAMALQKNQNVKLQVTGHTCDIGAAAYNQSLSLQRAQSVKDTLVKLGVQSDRIEIAGRGSREPISTDPSEAARQKNRRVEFILMLPDN